MSKEHASQSPSDAAWELPEVKECVRRIHNSKSFKSAPRRLELFKYLYKRRKTYSTSNEIWKEALLAHTGAKLEEGPDGDAIARGAVLDLRQVLEEHFRHVRFGWIIKLDKASPSRGYQLEVIKRADKTKATWAFWESHVVDGVPIYVVYIDQLFYRVADQKLVFRYYDCNSERGGDVAKKVLKAKHRGAFDAYDGQLRAVFPYVAWGELEARDLIREWFDKNAAVEVESHIPGHLSGLSIWNQSLILLGTADSNVMIQDVLDSYPSLPIKVDSPEGLSERVVITSPDEKEKESMEKAKAHLDVSFKEDNGIIATGANQDTMLIVLTRVPNPYNFRRTLTIFNSDYGRAIEQLAILLTDEERMSSAREIPLNLPQYFQAVFAVRLSELETHHRESELTMLALRDLQSHLKK